MAAIKNLRIPSTRSLGWVAPLAVLSAGAVVVELLAAMFVTVSITGGNPVGDWVSFYSAGTLIREGHGGQLFDVTAQAAAQRAVFERDLIANGYPLPAFVACIFAPFTFLSFVQSYWMWFAVNAAALSVLGIWAWKELRDVDPRLRLLLIAASALSTPVVYVLVLGQIDLFVAGSLIGCHVLLRSERRFSAGCVLGLAIAKPHLVAAAVLFLLVKREWRTLGGFTGVAVFLLAAPVFVFGPGIVVDQAQLLFSYPGSSTDYNVAAAMMVNLRGTFVSIEPSAPAWLWLPPLALIGACAIGLAVRHWKRNPAAAPRSWALVLILPLLYSPHVHIQTLVFVVAAAVLYVAAQDRRHPSVRPEHVLSALVLCVSLWLLSIAGLSLLCLLPMAAFAIVIRSWPRASLETLRVDRSLPGDGDGGPDSEARVAA